MKPLKTWLTNGCIWYTFLSLSMLLIGMLFSTNANTVSAVSFLLFFPCGLCMSAAGMLLRSNVLRKGIRHLLHYLITLVAFLLFVWIPSGTTATPAFLLFFWLLLSALYWLLFLALHLFRRWNGK